MIVRKKIGILCRFINLVFIFVWLGACSSIDIKDTNAKFPTFKVSKPIKSRVSFDAMVSSTHGTGDDEVINLELDRYSVPGTLQLSSDFELRSGAVLPKYTMLDFSRYKWNAGLGLCYVDMDLVLTDAANSAVYKYDNAGLGWSIKSEMLFPISEKFEIVFDITVLSITTGDQGELMDFSLGANYMLDNRIQLFIGYKDSRYDSSEFETDIQLTARGAYYGLGYLFDL